jgi:hypothetical protein
VFMFCHPEVTMYLLVYVDDIILVSSSMTAASRLVQDLRSAFVLKIWGPYTTSSVLKSPLCPMVSYTEEVCFGSSSSCRYASVPVCVYSHDLY